VSASDRDRGPRSDERPEPSATAAGDRAGAEQSRYADRIGGSDRQFGVVFAVVFGALGLGPWIFGSGPRLWAVAVAFGFAGLAAFAPSRLRPFNVAWTRLGLALNAVVSPVALAVVYFVGFAPMALVMRVLGRRPLRLHRAPETASYWVVREPPGPEPETMKNQF